VARCSTCKGLGRVRIDRYGGVECEECFGLGRSVTPLAVARLADAYEQRERDLRRGRIF